MSRHTNIINLVGCVDRPVRWHRHSHLQRRAHHPILRPPGPCAEGHILQIAAYPYAACAGMPGTFYATRLPRKRTPQAARHKPKRQCCSTCALCHCAQRPTKTEGWAAAKVAGSAVAVIWVGPAATAVVAATAASRVDSVHTCVGTGARIVSTRPTTPCWHMNGPPGHSSPSGTPSPMRQSIPLDAGAAGLQSQVQCPRT